MRHAHAPILWAILFSLLACTVATGQTSYELAVKAYEEKQQAGDHAQAETHARQAMTAAKEERQLTQAAVMLARAIEQQKKPQQALDVLSQEAGRANLTTTSRCRLLFELASLYNRMDQQAKAHETFQLIADMKNAPQRWRFAAMEAQGYMHLLGPQRDARQARDAFTSLARLDDLTAAQNAAIQYNLALVDRIEKKYDRAFKRLEKLINQEDLPPHTRNRYRMAAADTHFAADEIAKALAIYDTLLQDENAPLLIRRRAMYMKGMCFLHTGRVEEARHAFEQVKTTPGHADAQAREQSQDDPTLQDGNRYIEAAAKQLERLQGRPE